MKIRAIVFVTILLIVGSTLSSKPRLFKNKEEGKKNHLKPRGVKKEKNDIISKNESSPKSMKKRMKEMKAKVLKYTEQIELLNHQREMFLEMNDKSHYRGKQITKIEKDIRSKHLKISSIINSYSQLVSAVKIEEKEDISNEHSTAKELPEPEAEEKKEKWANLMEKRKQFQIEMKLRRKNMIIKKKQEARNNKANKKGDKPEPTPEEIKSKKEFGDCLLSYKNHLFKTKAQFNKGVSISNFKEASSCSSLHKNLGFGEGGCFKGLIEHYQNLVTSASKFFSPAVFGQLPVILEQVSTSTASFKTVFNETCRNNESLKTDNLDCYNLFQEVFEQFKEEENDSPVQAFLEISGKIKSAVANHRWKQLRKTCSKN